MRIVEGWVSIADVGEFIGQLDSIRDEFGCVVQAFDARYVAGRKHLESAVELANRAFEQGDTIARDRAVEILLYAAGRRQITEAMTLGVTKGDGPVAIVVDGGNEVGGQEAVQGLISGEQVLGVCRETEWIQEYFGITAAERAATDASLEELVIERVALLTIEK